MEKIFAPGGFEDGMRRSSKVVGIQCMSSTGGMYTMTPDQDYFPAALEAVNALWEDSQTKRVKLDGCMTLVIPRNTRPRIENEYGTVFLDSEGTGETGPQFAKLGYLAGLSAHKHDHTESFERVGKCVSHDGMSK